MKEYRSKRYPFASCPRQIGIPERINCFSEIQFFSQFNKVNGLKRKVYYSVYRTSDEGTFDNVIIDSIPFDLDSDKAINNIRKFHEYCMEHDYKHMLVFSTKGFWCFIKTTAEPLKNPKVALGEAQRKIAEHIGLTIGQSKDSDIDQAIVGDIARITRAINSKDVGRQRFCINLRAEEIYKTYEEIIELSQKPRFEYYIYGDKLFDLKPFDVEATHILPPMMGVHPKELELANIKMDVDIKSFLPCVQGWLLIPTRGVFNARYYYAVYCAQTGITASKCDEIAQKYFGIQPRTDSLRNNYRHFVKDSVIRKAYKDDKVFPNCDTLIQKGLCPGVCEKYAGKNSPIYYNGE